MGLFENIVSNAKQAANVVGKKTGELVDTSKLKLQAVDLNSDIKRNYEALGRAVYESRKQGIDSTEEIDDILINNYEDLAATATGVTLQPHQAVIVSVD